MLTDVLLLIAGLVLLLGGGDVMVRGASTLARSLGVSPLVIGLTVVAFGTSAPELAVNARAAIEGEGDISFGNIIGSNIANIGLILGTCALMKPLEIKGTVISREIPMMLLATAATVIMAMDVTLGTGSADVFDRTEAILLLLLFAVFLYYTIIDAVRHRKPDVFVEQATEHDQQTAPKTVWVSWLLTGIGLVGLVFGGEFTVTAAVALATKLEVPQSIIGLTIVALGTSLPELATGVVATMRGQTDLAVGNVVGSNIFNLLLVLGVTGCIGEVPVPAGGIIDLIVVAAFSIVLLPLAITNRRRIMRWEGAWLLAGYLAYTGFRAVPAFFN